MTTAGSGAQHTLDRFFSGTVDEKISAMNQLYAEQGREMLADRAISDALDLIRQYTAELSSQMLTMELDRLCTSCASQAEGGCCSSYMEANSDVMQLLINRLQGNRVCRQNGSEKSEECCFLGTAGCSLPVKPMFCLNYNCSHIHEQSSDADILLLEQLAGRLLTKQTELETLLLARV
jgi:hypothetical protein